MGREVLAGGVTGRELMEAVESCRRMVYSRLSSMGYGRWTDDVIDNLLMDVYQALPRWASYDPRPSLGAFANGLASAAINDWLRRESPKRGGVTEAPGTGTARAVERPSDPADAHAVRRWLRASRGSLTSVCDPVDVLSDNGPEPSSARSRVERESLRRWREGTSDEDTILDAVDGNAPRDGADWRDYRDDMTALKDFLEIRGGEEAWAMLLSRTATRRCGTSNGRCDRLRAEVLAWIRMHHDSGRSPALERFPRLAHLVELADRRKGTRR